MEVTTKFNLVVGCPSSLRQLPSGRCLVIDAESVDKDKWLHQEACITDPWPLDFKQSVITKTDGENIKWYTFSDARFNGPWSLTSYINQYPNLRSIGSRELIGESLASILNNQDILAHPSSTFQLVLRQGDPFDVLTSAGAWLARCSCITFRCKNCIESSLSRCEQLLDSLGFQQSCDDISVWSSKLKPFHLPLLLYGIRALFNADSYRSLHPDLYDASDSELMNHWLSDPNFTNISAEMKLKIQNSMDPLRLLSFFNTDAYRSSRPELNNFSDLDLINHWLAAPNLRGLLSQSSLLGNPPSEGDILLSDESLLEFLIHLFPFEYYMNIRPDLAGKSKKDLLIHFWLFGRTEGIDLSEGCIHDQLVSDVKSAYTSQIKALTGRIHELEQLLYSTRLQMNKLHLLINRLRESGRADD
tara:strand:+ start:2340 stop:3587 length:1248 start_codon:yes stop_codon:yes gene_type:complete